MQRRRKGRREREREGECARQHLSGGYIPINPPDPWKWSISKVFEISAGSLEIL
jgi:hypothetical protein